MFSTDQLIIQKWKLDFSITKPCRNQFEAVAIYIVLNPSTTLFIGKDCQVEEGLGHAFLILSRSDQTTMVLQTGQEINELDKGQSGFITDGPTVFCGNLGKFIETIPILCLYIVDVWIVGYAVGIQ